MKAWAQFQTPAALFAQAAPDDGREDCTQRSIATGAEPGRWPEPRAILDKTPRPLTHALSLGEGEGVRRTGEGESQGFKARHFASGKSLSGAGLLRAPQPELLSAPGPRASPQQSFSCCPGPLRQPGLVFLCLRACLKTPTSHRVRTRSLQESVPILPGWRPGAPTGRVFKQAPQPLGRSRIGGGLPTHFTFAQTNPNTQQSDARRLT